MDWLEKPSIWESLGRLRVLLYKTFKNNELQLLFTRLPFLGNDKKRQFKD